MQWYRELRNGRVHGSTVDVKQLRIRKDEVYDGYKRDVELNRVEQVNNRIRVQAMRDYKSDIGTLKREDLFNERAQYSEPISKRLRYMKPLFDEGKDADEDNPYSLAAVYKHNLSKQKNEEAGQNNERKQFQTQFDAQIQSKLEQIQSGRLSLPEYPLRPPKAILSEVSSLLSHYTTNYSLGPDLHPPSREQSRSGSSTVYDNGMRALYS